MKKFTKTHKKKLSISQMGSKNSFYGKTHTKEHKAKLKSIGKTRIGKNNPSWKGGRSRTPHGYIRIRLPYKRVMEHHIIIEKYLGRSLKPYERVHHINGIKDDNRIENLQIVFCKKHFGKIECPYCQKEFLIK